MQLTNDLSVKLTKHESEISACISRVVNSGWLVLGPEVERFERSFADYQSSKHCIGVANGTDALELALRAVGVSVGSKVATVANAGAYATTALTSIGAIPYFLEVDKESQCTTFESVKTALNNGVESIVVTHLFGRIVPEIAQIAALCEERKTPLIEDCAQAHGASADGKLAGCFGDIASFSFYPTKNLGALGDAGAVITNSDTYADKVTKLRQYGWINKYEIGLPGGRNSRLDALQAALLSEFLPYLNEWNDARLSIAQRYQANITHPLISKPIISQEKVSKPYVAHLYVVQTRFRDELRQHLKENKILTEVHYPIPDHMQATMSDSISLPVTELLAETILTLPCYPGMSEAQVNHVIGSLNSWKI